MTKKCELTNKLLVQLYLVLFGKRMASDASDESLTKQNGTLLHCLTLNAVERARDLRESTNSVMVGYKRLSC